MNAICARIGIRECLQEWNKDNVPRANRAAAKPRWNAQQPANDGGAIGEAK